MDRLGWQLALPVKYPASQDIHMSNPGSLVTGRMYVSMLVTSDPIVLDGATIEPQVTVKPLFAFTKEDVTMTHEELEEVCRITLEEMVGLQRLVLSPELWSWYVGRAKSQIPAVYKKYVSKFHVHPHAFSEPEATGSVTVIRT
jgi:hypothetical protein